jgi:hypothetical protein
VSETDLQWFNIWCGEGLKTGCELKNLLLEVEKVDFCMKY